MRTRRVLFEMIREQMWRSGDVLVTLEQKQERLKQWELARLQ